MKKKILLIICLLFIGITKVEAAGYYYEQDNGNYMLCQNRGTNCTEVDRNAPDLTVDYAQNEITYNGTLYIFDEETQEKYYEITYGTRRMYFYMENNKYVLCKEKGNCHTYTREQLEKKGALIANESRISLGEDETYYYNANALNDDNSNGTDNNGDTSTSDTNTDDTGYCTKLKEPLQFIGNLVLIFKVVIPIVIMIYGSVDFFRAIVGSKDDEIRKSGHSLLMRALAGVVIFLIPTVISFIFSLVSDFANIKGTFNACQKCIFNVRKCK